MKPRLVAISGPFEGQVFELTGKSFVLGRQADCDLQFTHIEVSRRHCEIVRLSEGHFVLRDLGSRHGTLVNGRPVEESALHHSDLVTLGNHALLFLLDDSSASRGDVATGSLPPPGASVERRLTETLHLDAARVDAALPAQARLARELHALLRLSTTLQEPREVGPLAARLLDAACDAVPAAERGVVLLREPGVEQPLRLATRGHGLSGLEGPGFAHLVGRMPSGSALWCPWVAEDPELAAIPGFGEVGALLAAPLAGSGGEPLGMVYLDRAEPGFAEHHLELLGAFAGVASLAFQNVLHLRWLEGENQRLREADAARHDMIGESPAMQRVLDLVARVARADSTVLIQGESGTGKELVAHAIHRSSPRSDGPFVAVNCATLSENLLESELFGHEKGAFTGAQTRKTGKMEAAHQGTLFLDEVAEIPIGLQAKLLRALQEREIERVGGTRPIPVDVRVVAATHRDLDQAVRDGEFRQDLLYRLKVIPCGLPPLRERREDIPLLARHFAGRHGEKLGLPALGIAPEARRSLLAYDWPGNVRELGNVIERAVVLGDGEVVRREDLPDEVATAAGASETSEAPVGMPDGGSIDFQGALVAFKKQLILDAWNAAGEDYGRTAERLGVHVNSLHRMVKNLDLKDALGR